MEDEEDLMRGADSPSLANVTTYVRSAKAIAGAVAYFCQVLVIRDGGSNLDILVQIDYIGSRRS